jgi:hypothetical protein
MTMDSIKAQANAILIRSKMPYHSINVFGTIRLNIHVQCIGQDTAQKWQKILVSGFPGSDVKIVKTMWDASENKNTVLRPTRIYGYLVALVA